MNMTAARTPQPAPAYNPGVYFTDIFGVDTDVLA